MKLKIVRIIINTPEISIFWLVSQTIYIRSAAVSFMYRCGSEKANEIIKQIARLNRIRSKKKFFSMNLSFFTAFESKTYGLLFDS